MSEDRIEGIERTINMRRYMTPVGRDNIDIQNVMDTETIEFQELWDALCDCFNNIFVKYMTEYGLTKWESIYQLHVRATDTIEDRRRRVLSAFMGTRPYTLKKFREILDTVYGKGAVIPVIDGDKYLCTFHLEGVKTSQLDELTDFIEEILPKNLGFLYAYTVEFENTMRLAFALDQSKTVDLYPGIELNLDVTGKEAIGAAYLMELDQGATYGVIPEVTTITATAHPEIAMAWKRDIDIYPSQEAV